MRSWKQWRSDFGNFYRLSHWRFKMCIQDGKNGLLVPCGEEEKFAEAMMHLAKDREYADALGKEAANIRNSFSEETISQKNGWMNYRK